MLRREDSNKVLKGIKAVIFAGTLSMLCPMNVEAKEVVYEQQVETDSPSPSVFIKKIAGGCLTIVVTTIGITLGLELLIKKHPPVPKAFIGQIENGNQDDIKEAVKYLKLTNGSTDN